MGGFHWQSLFTPLLSVFRSPPNPEIKALKEADHTYIRGHESQRSPCPFLNSLANHNYLYVYSSPTDDQPVTFGRPRDGKNITRDKLKAALIVSGNCTPLFADVLTSVVKQVTRDDGTFTLVDLRQHNAVEHDASFTRLDYRQGDNTTFQPAMFEAMMKYDAKGGPITADSIARTRVRRDKEEKMAGAPGVTFFGSPKIWATTWSQTCILLETFGPKISVEDITMLYTEEQLPEWWLQSPGRMTFVGQLRGMATVFWKHLFVTVDDDAIKNPLRGW
jgi:hypothetical protein